MATVSHYNPMSKMECLKSDADCVVYTYGVGNSETQATPPYILELARNNPSKTYELIHSDPTFSFHPTTQLSSCLNEQDWQFTTSENSANKYQSKKYPNLKARLVQAGFSGYNDSFKSAFFNYLTQRLEQQSEIFLGVHATCWIDDQGCMGESYNKLRKNYAGRIYLYNQAGDVPAIIHKGPYNPLFGLCANSIHWDHPEVWVAFQRVFSQANPLLSDVQKVREAFRHFLAARQNPQLDQKITELFQSQHGKALEAVRNSPDQDLTNYLDKPLENRVIVMPLKLLTAQMWEAEPGQEVFPNQTALHGEDRALAVRNARCRKYFRVCSNAVGVATIAITRFLTNN